MFFVWGSKWQHKIKKNGLRIHKFCPECDSRGEFFEVIPSKYFTLFWIPLSKTRTKKPLLECPHCHERFYIQQHDYMNAIHKLSTVNQNKQLHVPQEDHSSGHYTVNQCQNCEQKLRIPIKKKPLKITCPSCKNIFHFQNGKKV